MTTESTQPYSNQPYSNQVYSNDCLVFRIIEKDTSAQKEDTDIFILYDSYHSVYLLRGKRSDTRRVSMRDYSFESYSVSAVMSFLSIIIPKNHRCVFELYSYSDLPKNKDDITFESLRYGVDPATEVVAYEHQRIRCNIRLYDILTTIAEVTNDYVPDEEESDYDEQAAIDKWNAECDKRW